MTKHVYSFGEGTADGDGKMKERKADLLAAVKRCDILMYRGWFKSPEAEMVRYLYREARR